jgi:oligosaccharide repeat unit polymerase
MIDWAERAVCILLSLCILANALLVRRMVQAWAFPAVIFSLAWFFYTIVPLVCFPEAHVYPTAVLYILCATIAFSLGSLSNWQAVFAHSTQAKAGHEDFFSSRLLFIMFAGAFALTVVFLLLNSIEQGISLDRLTSNVNDSAAEYAERRYASDISSNIYQQLANILAYFCAGLGGLISVYQSSRLRRWSITIVALFPSLFVMLTQSAKGMLFLSMAIFFGGVLASRLQHNQTALLSRRALPDLMIALIALVPLVTISFLARGLTPGAGQNIFQILAPYWASYTSGHLFAFSDWFGSYTGLPSMQGYDDPSLTGGFYTFMALFRLFGDDRFVPLGIYAEFISIPPYIETNIYTVFRGLIIDYGLLGSLVAITFLSYLFHIAYRVMITTAQPGFSVAVFIFTIAVTYQSFGVSSLTWTTLPVGLLLIGVVLYAGRVAATRQHIGSTLHA